MKVLVVDPGMSGAVVLFSPEGLQVHRDFKHGEDIAYAVAMLAPSATEAVMELTSARPGQGVTSMYGFGNAAGIVQGSLFTCGFSLFHQEGTPGKKLFEVHPIVWKGYIRTLAGLKPEEDFDAVALARYYLPHARQYLERKKDHNTADALLMGLWYIATKPAVGSLRARDKKRHKANKKPRS